MPARRNGESGFTLIELLVVVAIIGILASMIIPSMLSALHKAKQKRSVMDIHDVGTAMMAWLTDQSAAAAAGAQATVDLTDFASITTDDLIKQLEPLYVQRVPIIDGWKYSYDYYLNVGNPVIPNVMGVRSPGRDGAMTGDTYDSGPFSVTDYDQDIVWTDGYFVRWPSSDH